MATRNAAYYDRSRTEYARVHLAFPGRAIVLFLAGLLANAPSANAEPGDELTVYLLTMGPGQAVYERFGHNAILVEDKVHKTSRAFNYGIFDFAQHNFILRFVLGRMQYQVAAWPGPGTVAEYIAQDRSVCAQELNLSPAQRLALRDFLEWNCRPENASYRYDYYTENCSTKVRDALDRVVGGAIHERLAAIQTSRTYRWYTRRAMTGSIPLYTALNYVLGHPVDRPLSGWDEAFLPEKLQEYIQTVQVRDSSGAWVPLVKSAVQLHQSRTYSLPDAPPAWGWAYLIVGILVGGALAGLGWCAGRGKWWRRALATVGGLWVFVVAFAGCFAVVVWLATSHVAGYRNENLLQFSPLAAALLVLLPAAACGKRWAMPAGLWVGVFMAGCSLLGLLLKVIPVFDQVNWDMIALMLPANAGLAAALWLVWANGRKREEPDVKKGSKRCACD